MNPDQLNQAITEAYDHMRWLHEQQASNPDDPDIQKAITQYTDAYARLVAAAQKYDPDSASAAAGALAQARASSGLYGAQAEEANARAEATRATTARVGMQTPDSAATNATQLQVAGINAASAAAGHAVQAQGQQLNYQTAQAQNAIARDQLELQRQQEEAKAKVAAGTWTEQEAERHLISYENALNRSLEIWKTQTQVETNKATERNSIRSTEAQTRDADVQAANSAGSDALKGYEGFMDRTTPSGLGDYMKQIWDNQGDTTKMPGFTPRNNNTLDLNALIEGARSRERANLSGFGAPQYGRGETVGDSNVPAPPNPGGQPPSTAFPTAQNILDAPQTHLGPPGGDNAGPLPAESPTGYRTGRIGAEGEPDWQVYTMPPGFDKDELLRRLAASAAGGQNG